MEYFIAGVVGYCASRIEVLLTHIFPFLLFFTPFKIYRFTNPMLYSDWLR